MAKAYSKAAKLRAKKAKMPELAATPPRKKRGKARMQEIERENIKSNLIARARQLGVEDPDAMRAQMLGEAAGQALYLSCEAQEAKDLWDHYAALTSAKRRFERSLGVSSYPKVAKIEYMPERMETSADDSPPDLRTEQERDEQAAAKWQDWQDTIAKLGLRSGASIYGAMYGFGTMVRDGQVTLTGKRFVIAMRDLAKIV